MSIIQITRRLVERYSSNWPLRSSVMNCVCVKRWSSVDERNSSQVSNDLGKSSCTAMPGLKNIPRDYRRLAKKQKKFQVENGIPIFLKGGKFDKILYQTTIVLCWLGLIMSVKTIFNMSYPKMPEKAE